MSLGLTIAPNLPGRYSVRVTYSEALWSDRGEQLLQDIESCLAALEDDHDDEQALQTMSELNDHSLTLGAIRPEWLDFSTKVFIKLIGYNHSKKSNVVRDLKKAYKKALCQKSKS